MLYECTITKWWKSFSKRKSINENFFQYFNPLMQKCHGMKRMFSTLINLTNSKNVPLVLTLASYATEVHNLEESWEIANKLGFPDEQRARQQDLLFCFIVWNSYVQNDNQMNTELGKNWKHREHGLCTIDLPQSSIWASNKWAKRKFRK